MTDVKAIKWISHFDDCLVIRYQVFVPNLVISFDLIEDQLWIAISLKLHTPISWASWRPISRVLYSATLLEQGVVNENAREKTWFCGETNTTPTPAIILPLGPILDAPSKNICHTSSSKIAAVNTDLNFLILFKNGDNVSNPIRCCSSYIKPHSMSLWTSALVASMMSGRNRCYCCFTGLTLGLMFNRCMAICGSRPGISS